MNLSRSLVTLLIATGSTFAQAPKTDAEIEAFLRDAKMGDRRPIAVGVTNTERAPLTQGGFTHDCHIQTVDIRKQEYRTDRGVEINFRDTYKFNIAAYKLSRLLNLNMFPVTVDRKVAGKSASVTWWIDDAMMEGERMKKKIQPPDQERWNNQMYVARVFDELIYDNDPNVGNFLIDKNWKLWMVDKTRAFRFNPDLRNVKNLVKCERSLLESLKGLNEQTLLTEMKGLLEKSEIRALVARRDKIVAFFTKEVSAKGAAAVLYDLPEALAR